MTGDAKDWVEDALRLCEKAKASGALLLLRNDDEEIVVTNATTPEGIKALGEALACGYGEPGEEE